MGEGDTPTEGRERPRRIADEALASSSPDVHHGFMQLVQRLFGSESRFKVLSGALLAGLMMLFVVGLPAINGTTILIDKLTEREGAERSFQLEMFKLQTDVELKKLDRQLLNEGASATLNEINLKLTQQGDQLRTQGELIADQGKQLDKLAGSVGILEARQAGSSKRIDSLAQAQQRLQGSFR